MLKRPFVCVAIAFAAGILSFAYELNIFLLLATSLILTGVVYFCGKKHRFLFFTMIIVFLLGVSGMKLADWRRGEILRHFENREMEITATVTDFSADGKVIANLILYKNKIIAGDICCTEGGGFVSKLIK